MRSLVCAKWIKKSPICRSDVVFDAKKKKKNAQIYLHTRVRIYIVFKLICVLDDSWRRLILSGRDGQSQRAPNNDCLSRGGSFAGCRGRRSSLTVITAWTTPFPFSRSPIITRTHAVTQRFPNATAISPERSRSCLRASEEGGRMHIKNRTRNRRNYNNTGKSIRENAAISPFQVYALLGPGGIWIVIRRVRRPGTICIANRGSRDIIVISNFPNDLAVRSLAITFRGNQAGTRRVTSR